MGAGGDKGAEGTEAGEWQYRAYENPRGEGAGLLTGYVSTEGKQEGGDGDSG